MSAQSVITATALSPLQIPIHVPFTISRESLGAAQIILVDISSESEGEAHCTGLGECAPFPSLTHDDIPTAQRIAQGLLDEIQGRTLTAAFRRLRELKAEASQQSITGFVGVEGALWDLQAKVQRCPLRQLWGSGQQTSLTTDITLPIMQPEAISRFWQLYASFAFTTIKVKVSGHVDQDLAMIMALARLVPPTTQYILDGNQGFAEDAAEALVAKLMKQGIQPLFFEQPLAEDDSAGLVRLSQRLPIPICADESVRTQRDLKGLLEAGMRPIVNIKIMKSGIEESLGLIAMAQQAACPLMIGGMLESEVAMSLSLQMACGTEAIRYADLDTPFFFKEHVTVQSPWHACQAELLISDAHGHGLSRVLPR